MHVLRCTRRDHAELTVLGALIRLSFERLCEFATARSHPTVRPFRSTPASLMPNGRTTTFRQLAVRQLHVHVQDFPRAIKGRSPLGCGFLGCVW
jgi:hypothetical protein